MKTIKDNVETQLIINKSKFIGIMISVSDINEIKLIIKQLKLKYPDATHYCYAYIIDNFSKASDDGEPSGTAGIPILNVLKKENLTNVLCVVIRYFGGTKLGSPGLIRAYSKITTTALKTAIIGKLIPGLEITITFNYDVDKIIDYIIKNALIKEALYNEEITYTFDISVEEFNIIYHELQANTNTIYTNKNIFIFK